MTPLMLEALCDHLLEKPKLYLEEMAVFLWDEFDSNSSYCKTRRRILLSPRFWFNCITVLKKAVETYISLLDQMTHVSLKAVLPLRVC